MLTPRAVGGAIVAASVAALAAAFLAQYVAGLDPCPLCVYQRYPYGATLALGVLALAAPGRWPALFVGLAGAAFAAGAGTALWHVGVQAGWFEELAVCAGGDVPQTLDDMRAQLAGPAPPPCGEVAWSLFGVSIPGYNLMYSAALAALSLGAAAALARKAQP